MALKVLGSRPAVSGSLSWGLPCRTPGDLLGSPLPHSGSAFLTPRPQLGREDQSWLPGLRQELEDFGGQWFPPKARGLWPWNAGIQEMCEWAPGLALLAQCHSASSSSERPTRGRALGLQAASGGSRELNRQGWPSLSWRPIGEEGPGWGADDVDVPWGCGWRGAFQRGDLSAEAAGGAPPGGAESKGPARGVSEAVKEGWSSSRGGVCQPLAL